MQLPSIRPVGDCIFSSGVVMAIRGSCKNMPKKATPSDSQVSIPLLLGMLLPETEGGESKKEQEKKKEKKLTNDVVGGNPDQNLVQDGGDEEDGDARDERTPSPADHGHEDVALEVLVHGLVPRAPVSAQALAVPPVVVERPVSEPRHFGQGVEERLEKGEETGEPDDEGDGGELHQALQDIGEVERGDLVEGVAQDRGGVLLASEPDEHAQAEDLSEALSHKYPTDPVGSGVGRLVDEGRRPPEIN